MGAVRANTKYLSVMRTVEVPRYSATTAVGGGQGGIAAAADNAAACAGGQHAAALHRSAGPVRSPPPERRVHPPGPRPTTAFLRAATGTDTDVRTATLHGSTRHARPHSCIENEKIATFGATPSL